MEYLKKSALFNEEGERISDFFDEIDTESSAYFAIVRKTENDVDMFNCLQSDGTLLSKKWFKKVEPFKNEDISVRVIMLDDTENILHYTGKLLLKRKNYTVVANMRWCSTATIKNERGLFNLLTEEGKFVSKRWFYSVSEVKKTSCGYGVVKVLPDLYNILKKDGKLLLRYSADFIQVWMDKYYVARSYTHNSITVIRMSDYKVVFDTSMREASFLSRGILITNEEGKMNILSNKTLKPVFKEWQQHIFQMPYMHSFIIVSENISSKNHFFIYDYEGNKVINTGFASIFNFRGNVCNVEIYNEHYEDEEPYEAVVDIVKGEIRNK